MKNCNLKRFTNTSYAIRNKPNRNVKIEPKFSFQKSLIFVKLKKTR